MTPRLSIITACYNHGQYVGECIDSVLAQTEPNIEHIVVIDGATDNSLEVAIDRAKRDLRVHVLDNGRNLGLAVSENTGIARASAPWVLKVDADDKIDARYVQAILEAADGDARRNVIFAPARHFGNRNDVWIYPDFDPARMIDQFLIPGPAAFRVELWDAVGGFDETMRSAEDWDFWIRAHLAHGLVTHQIKVPGLYWWYRVHSGPRASAEGIARIAELQAYWRGHTRETVLARSRSWGDYHMAHA